MLTENASKIQQKYLGAKGLIVLIAVMNMFVPLSIDLYLPALPTIGTEFAATPLMVNLTLVSFFFFFAVGILLFGPVSDKYGRRKILLLGIVLYTLASGLCAFAGSILQSDSVQNRAGFGCRRHGCCVDGGCQRCFLWHH